MVSPSAIRDKTVRKRIRGRFRIINAHAKQERSELCQIGTARVSQNPTTVVTANGEVQTKEDATVYVKELNLFVTVRLLEDTPAVLSLGKLCEDHGIFRPLDQWSETTTHQRWQTNKMQHGELRTDRCPWFIDRLFKLNNSYISNIIIAGSRSSHTASRINKK